MATNRKIGNSFETEFCELLFQHGFWCHNMAQNAAGQPADVIAVKGKTAYLIDCKVCSNNRFHLSRVEENQHFAIVPCYTYQENNREENLVYEDIDVVAGEVETYYIQDPSYGYKVKLDEVEGKATVVAWSNYFVTIKFNVTGSFKLEVQGYRYKIVEKYATVSLNARGKTVKWKNPLISNTTMANELAAWLADYYTAGIEYEYDTRGNPELDATDIVYQENEFHDGMRVNIYRHTVNFKQAFSGRVTARRIGG